MNNRKRKYRVLESLQWGREYHDNFVRRLSRWKRGVVSKNEVRHLLWRGPCRNIKQAKGYMRLLRQYPHWTLDEINAAFGVDDSEVKQAPKVIRAPYSLYPHKQQALKYIQNHHGSVPMF